MISSPRILCVLGLATTALAGSVGCPLFNNEGQLLIFGLGVDVQVSAQATWPTPTVSTLSTSFSSQPTPPYTGTPQCFLDQVTDQAYIFGSDSKNGSAVWSYSDGFWDQSNVLPGGTTGGADLIVSNVNYTFYTFSAGSVWTFSTIDSTPLTWKIVSTSPGFTDVGYSPTFTALDRTIRDPDFNYADILYFFGATGAAAGQANLFVADDLEVRVLESEKTTFAPTKGSAFPSSHGQAFTLGGQPQNLIAFVPDDMSATYLLDTIGNTSLALPGPHDTTIGSVFTASATAIVQLTPPPANALWYLPIDQKDVKGTGANANAAWSQITFKLPASGSSGGSGTGSGGTGSGGTGSGGTGSSGGDVSGGTVATAVKAVSIAAIAGGVIGGLIFLGAFIALIFILTRMRRRRVVGAPSQQYAGQQQQPPAAWAGAGTGAYAQKTEPAAFPPNRVQSTFYAPGTAQAFPSPQAQTFQQPQMYQQPQPQQFQQQAPQFQQQAPQFQQPQPQGQAYQPGAAMYSPGAAAAAAAAAYQPTQAFPPAQPYQPQTTATGYPVEKGSGYAPYAAAPVRSLPTGSSVGTMDDYSRRPNGEVVLTAASGMPGQGSGAGAGPAGMPAELLAHITRLEGEMGALRAEVADARAAPPVYEHA